MSMAKMWKNYARRMRAHSAALASLYAGRGVEIERLEIESGMWLDELRAVMRRSGIPRVSDLGDSELLLKIEDALLVRKQKAPEWALEKIRIQKRELDALRRRVLELEGRMPR